MVKSPIYMLVPPIPTRARPKMKAEMFRAPPQRTDTPIVTSNSGKNLLPYADSIVVDELLIILSKSNRYYRARLRNILLY
jgi:hypothetical protein